jgi:hypothetical protein
MRHLPSTRNELKMRDDVSSVTAWIVNEPVRHNPQFRPPEPLCGCSRPASGKFSQGGTLCSLSNCVCMLSTRRDEPRGVTADQIRMDFEKRTANGALTTSLAMKTGIPVSPPELISNTSYVPFNATQPDEPMTKRIDIWHKAAAPSPAPRDLRRSSDVGKPLNGATDNCRIF